MANGSDPPVLRYIRKLKAQIDAAGAPDGALLARFVRERDEEAFAVLMRRHGPMVLAVCRRILRNAHDADDAFQATFLILVRKAGSLGQPDLLANWLYGVATRTAFKAKTESLRRHRLECALSASLFAAGSADENRELRDVLDEELRRLPERYRVPVLLCDLEGRTHQEVAKLLKCPRETVTTRLTRARLKLRQRLERRGVVLGVGGVAALIGDTALPSGFAKTTIQAALLVAAGKATAAAALSASAVALMEGMLKTMLITKLKVAAAVVLIVGLLGGGATALKVRTQAVEPADSDKEQPAKPTPQPRKTPTVRVQVPSARDGVLLMVGTEIKAGEKLPLNNFIGLKNIKGELETSQLPSKLTIELDKEGKAIIVHQSEQARASFEKMGLDNLKAYRRLRLGETIVEGQLLGIMDDRLAQLDVAIKNSKVKQAEQDAISSEKTRDEFQARYENIRKVRGRTGGAAKTDEEAEAAKLQWDRYSHETIAKKEAILSAKHELKQAQIVLESFEIRSRVRGVLRAIHKHPGEAVKSLETVFEIEVAKEPE